MRLGVPELLIILVIVILVFGVGKLPEVGSSLGKAIRGFREETEVKPAEKKTEDNKEVKKD
ncbi:MAG TPA: twin-arginine translocase TatA/TatE family subunit [Anaerolineae bacterium]|nr:twin-arginine translocase TatA/TatE family subunit [Anaerolineae bacterium]HNT05352.1 twin-arginine translocase TatA/TatE family subunit [Anaerolineae bacterium]